MPNILVHIKWTPEGIVREKPRTAYIFHFQTKIGEDVIKRNYSQGRKMKSFLDALRKKRPLQLQHHQESGYSNIANVQTSRTKLNSPPNY